MQLWATFSVCSLMLWSWAAVACTEGWPPREKSVVKGEATSTSGETLYIETLYFEPGADGGSLQVDYTVLPTKLIARKIVHYNCNPTTPSYELTDVLDGIKEGVNWRESDVIAYLDNHRTTLKIPQGQTIVDAGFDNAIRMNWEALTAGNKVRFNYLLSQESRFIRLRLVKSEKPAILNSDETDDTVFFKIAANNLIYRLLSSPIYVGYDPDTQAIRYYIGPSNLRSMVNHKKVVIRYQGPDS